MNIGFVSTRLAGTDGVSLETRKWMQIAERLGHQVFACAGELDADIVGHTVPEMHFQHLPVQGLQSLAFGDAEPNAKVLTAIEHLAAQLQEHLAEFQSQYKIDCMVFENALAIPMHLALGLAITRFLEATGLPAVGHHHDFYWERERFAENCVQGLLDEAFPPDLPNLRHAVINSAGQESLRRRSDLESVIVPNIFDFARAAPGLTDRSRDMRARLGLDDGHLLILQPTRVIARKGIELAIEFVRRLQQPHFLGARMGKEPVLVISHHAGDEGLDYLHDLQRQAEAADVKLLYVADLYAAHVGDEGNAPFALWDAYVQADFVTYPSLIEGFGNALLETVYFRLPALVNRYDIYVSDIGPLGFDFVEIDGAVTDEAVIQGLEAMMDPVRRRRMVEHNYELARAHFSLEAVTPLLSALFEQ
jgi:glycosyltransferase involved in cell wall biosynthesis